jgi:23S rRNA (cytidine1920-2'-O)/16S rRNA (cytidine1409-2'-O)-methyltransferase
MARRQRLDAEMVRRGLAASRRDAQVQIEGGRVLVAGAVADKAARLVDPAEPVLVVGPSPRFVSRGGEKLDHALDQFGIDVSGWRALDAGASTGGFTDCLLQRGARQVVALDVGHGQLHERIRAHPDVVVVEGYNVRNLQPADIGGPVDLVVADLSFISLRLVIPALMTAVAPGGTLVLLVKPQFEAGRQEVSRGRGVVTDAEVHQRVCDQVGEALGEAGADVRGWVASPITGASGNREFLVHAIAGPAVRASGSAEEAT